MSYQSELSRFDDEIDPFDRQPVNVSEAVRNATFHMIQEELPQNRRLVYERILQFPDGIPNKTLAKELGWPINCVTPRVKELTDMGLVEDCGIAYLPDHNGRLHPNTLRRVVQ